MQTRASGRAFRSAARRRPGPNDLRAWRPGPPPSRARHHPTAAAQRRNGQGRIFEPCGAHRAPRPRPCLGRSDGGRQGACADGSRRRNLSLRGHGSPRPRNASQAEGRMFATSPEPTAIRPMQPAPRTRRHAAASTRLRHRIVPREVSDPLSFAGRYARPRRRFRAGRNRRLDAWPSGERAGGRLRIAHIGLSIARALRGRRPVPDSTGLRGLAVHPPRAVARAVNERGSNRTYGPDALVFPPGAASLGLRYTSAPPGAGERGRANRRAGPAGPASGPVIPPPTHGRHGGARTERAGPSGRAALRTACASGSTAPRTGRRGPHRPA